jgi:hypothetical protein
MEPFHGFIIAKREGPSRILRDGPLLGLGRAVDRDTYEALLAPSDYGPVLLVVVITSFSRASDLLGLACDFLDLLGLMRVGRFVMPYGSCERWEFIAFGLGNCHKPIKNFRREFLWTMTSPAPVNTPFDGVFVDEDVDTPS